MLDRALTPPAIARLLAVHPDKIRAWITRGELAAVDLADRRGGRPRWRVMPDALEAFLAARQATPWARTKRRTKKVRTRWF
jgi:excisionase family DNA binding protein